jgi:hypothetical protein
MLSRYVEKFSTTTQTITHLLLFTVRADNRSATGRARCARSEARGFLRAFREAAPQLDYNDAVKPPDNESDKAKPQATP